MKKILLIIALFFNVSLFAQMAKLSELSSSEFLNSKIIYEDNNSDIYGYFLLYLKDRKDKDVYEFEYVLMDKNLNKLGTGTFFQSRYTTMLIKFISRLLYVKKSGDMLYFSVGDTVEGTEEIFDIFGFYNLRTLNLKDFKVSEQNYIKNLSPIVVGNEKLRSKEFKEYNYLKPTNNNGFIVFDESVMDVSMRYFAGKSKIQDVKKFKFFDLDLKEKWTFNYDTGDAKSFNKYIYYAGDKNDMIFRKEFYESPKDETGDVSFDFIDAATGAKKI
ncbi:DUF6770 family protein [Flavobacterium sp. 3HN19-14]|uniref:DUF6770 family protein n=1 Tax=Flavobacterium sp. 3HN19-14 TaxID=3448133 RepID=UPI003EDF7DBD